MVIKDNPTQDAVGGEGSGSGGEAGSAAPTGDVGGQAGTLEAQLAAARDEARRNHDRWLRERADLENLKKRGERERAETIRLSNERILRDLLPVLDNLERAIEHVRGGGNGPPVIEGLALVQKGFLDVLERHGVTRIDAIGARFDPASHEAMEHRETTEHEPNSVMIEHQKGYRLHDRLLRPALVSVAKGPAQPSVRRGGSLAKDEGRD